MIGAVVPLLLAVAVVPVVPLLLAVAVVPLLVLRRPSPGMAACDGVVKSSRMSKEERRYE